MIDSTQASAFQAACGAKPEVCSAQVAPFVASADSRRCSTMPTMTISDERQPDRLHQHGAQGGREHLRERFGGGVDHAGKR